MSELTLKFIAIFPEMLLGLMAVVALLAGVFSIWQQRTTYYLVQLILIITMLLVIFNAIYLLKYTAITFLFNNMLLLDPLSYALQFFILLCVFFTFIYSYSYNDERRVPHNEFYVLGLFSTLGMMFLVAAHNLLILFLSLELLSLPIYAMVALQRSKERCVEAALKYFIIGAIATGMLLYGMSLLFGVTLSLDITQIADVLMNLSLQHNLVLLFGLVFILAGILFKLGAAPFHMWVPDVYDGAPSSITLFLSTAPKLAAFGFAIRMLVQALPSFAVEWSQMLVVAAIFSIVLGNLAAIVQSNIKRMLAYSSIAHMGYMLLGLSCATSRGYIAAMFYVISYALMTLGAFAMVILMGRTGLEANRIDDFAGLNNRNPWLAFMMMIVMFSMAGVPPLVGFIAKVGIIEALMQIHRVWLAVVAILFAIIGCFYYLRVVRVMYFGDLPSDNRVIKYASDLKVAITINGFAVLLLGIFPGALFALCHLTF